MSLYDCFSYRHASSIEPPFMYMDILIPFPVFGY